MGRYKDPDSRRSKQEAARSARLGVVGLGVSALEVAGMMEQSARLTSVPNTGSSVPVCPAWAAETVRVIFVSIVSDLIAAKVPLKRIDGHAVLMAAQCVDGVREATAIGEDPEA